MGRDPSTISRELAHNRNLGGYQAVQAGRRAESLLRQRGREPKLAQQGPLFEAVTLRLFQRWSPQQIALDVKRNHPDEADRRVSHETMYQAFYALPKRQW